MFATTAVAEMLLEGGLLQKSRLRALLTGGDQLRGYMPRLAQVLGYGTIV